jgi:NADH-quinone oxidoreductase subunit M
MPDGFPILTALIVLPALGALVVALLPRTALGAIRGVTLAVATVTFLLSLLVLGGFTVGEPGFQLGEQVDWIPQWGISYRLGVDGVFSDFPNTAFAARELFWLESSRSSEDEQ